MKRMVYSSSMVGGGGRGGIAVVFSGACCAHRVPRAWSAHIGRAQRTPPGPAPSQARTAGWPQR
jgi:hypothetical protein